MVCTVEQREKMDVKIIADTLVRTAIRSDRDGYARGRKDALEEAARIILAAAQGRHRHVAAYLVDALIAASKQPGACDLRNYPCLGTENTP